MTPTESRPRRLRRDPRPRQVGWRTRDVLRVALVLVGVYLALQLLWVGRSVFFVGFLGVLFGLTVAAGVDRLERHRVPRVVGTMVIVLLTLGALTGLGWLTAPRIAEQLRDLRQQVPEAIDQVEGWVQQRMGGVAEFIGGEDGGGSQPAGRDARAGEQGESGGEQSTVDIRKGLAQQVAGVGRNFFSVFSSTLSVLAGLLLIVFVTIFVAADPGLYHRGLMHLFPHPARARAGEVLTATAATLRRWLLMQLIAMIVIGVVTTAVLLLLDVKAAIALGIIAGLLEFIPYIGPILSAVPALAMALLDGPEKALYVVIAYTGIQQLENALLQPILMKEGLELPPLVTLLGQAVFSLAFGFIGLLVSVPLLATIIVPVKMLYVQDVVGDDVEVLGEGGG